MDKMIAFCGINCAECEAYLATQSGDQAWIERIAASSREQYHDPNITAATVACDGCQAATDRHCGYCAECGIRACGQERGLANCAYCQDYESCQRLADFFQMAPAVKANLEEIRRFL